MHTILFLFTALLCNLPSVTKQMALPPHAGLNFSLDLDLETACPEVRHQKCIDKTFDYMSMPSISIIIPYLHENFTLIKQTVGSILVNTPHELLDQILFIDDANEEEWSKHTEIEALHDKVHVHRNKRRQGLIRCKKIGAALTNSSVIVFMEPHVRANRYWLEPLLERLLQSPDHKEVVVPMLDIIPQYKTSSYIWAYPQIGEFSWDLVYTWFNTTGVNKSYEEPDIFQTPALCGGIFAIWRDWWEKSGTYDWGMTEWGYENIEMSLRVWRCGGSIVTVPCSRIAHLFRKKFPYQVHDQSWKLNKKRLVDVWLDNYTKNVYKVDPKLREMHSGPLDDRLQLKKDLQCKSMDWYVHNVHNPQTRA